MSVRTKSVGAQSIRASVSRRVLAAATGGALLAGLVAATPAQALDDGAENIFSSIASLLTAGIGVGGGESKPQIEYRERAPLVLPPNLQQLPPPGSGGAAARNAAWPQDFDVQRHQRQVARERRPRENDDNLSARAPMPTGGPVAATRDPRECKDDALERLCDTEGFWKTMRTTRSTKNDQKVAVGQEPPRRSLTDPPTGFRRQASDQRYTFEVEQKVDITDARAQTLEEQRRRQAISEGRNPNY